MVTDEMRTPGHGLRGPGSEGASSPETDAVARARTVSHLLDDAVTIPVIHYRVGLDPILGILPVYGDAIAAVASLYIVFQGLRAGVPRRTLATMCFLVGAEFAIGSVPVLGTLFDAVVKVNRRNARVIEAHVDDA